MLDGPGLDAYITDHFTSTLFRLEQLPVYDVDANGGDLERYLSGEAGPDMSRKGPWLEVIRDEVSRGLHTYRVHVLRAPLTDYERFEFEWGFVLNEQAGEHIRVLDLTERPLPSGLVDEDFWLIEEDHAVSMVYDDQGRFVGAEAVEDPTALARYCAARTAAWSAAIPFTDWWRSHPQYWRDHRAAG